MLRALDAETRPGGNTYALWGIVLTDYGVPTWRRPENLSGGVLWRFAAAWLSGCPRQFPETMNQRSERCEHPLVSLSKQSGEMCLQTRSRQR